jgi:hypothetical protein
LLGEIQAGDGKNATFFTVYSTTLSTEQLAYTVLACVTVTVCAARPPPFNFLKIRTRQLSNIPISLYSLSKISCFGSTLCIIKGKGTGVGERLEEWVEIFFYQQCCYFSTAMWG